MIWKKLKIIRDKLKDKIMVFEDFLILKKKKEDRKKKKQNEKINRDNIIRDITILFEQEKEEDYYEPKRVSNFRNNNVSSMKVMAIKIENYHLMKYCW